MSSLHGIDLVIGRIWEDLTLSSKEIVLEGYLEIYNDMCIVCSGDVTDGKCEDGACPGPASKTPEDICEEAFHAMHDNLGDMDFDTDAMSLLSSFIEVWLKQMETENERAGLTLCETHMIETNYRPCADCEE